MAVTYENYEGRDIRDRNPWHSRVQWGAVFAGVVVAIIVQVLLSLLGLAIGFQAIDPGNIATRGLGWGSGLWLIISAMISMFAGGWTASAMASNLIRMDGIMHGILVWGVMAVLAVFLLGTGLGNILGGAMGLTTAAVSGATQGVATQAAQEGVAGIQQQLEQIVPEQEGQQQQAQQQQQQQQPGAVDVEQVADTTATVFWIAFVAALLSLIAGAVGGLAGLRSQPVRRPAAAA